jgi:hypothetical protein
MGLVFGANPGQRSRVLNLEKYRAKRSKGKRREMRISECITSLFSSKKKYRAKSKKEKKRERRISE